MQTLTLPPPPFTGNASDEFAVFFAAAYEFAAKWYTDVKVQVSTHKDGTADGITIWLMQPGWAADMYGDFVQVLHKLPTEFPNGDIHVDLMAVGGGKLLHLWHD